MGTISMGMNEERDPPFVVIVESDTGKTIVQPLEYDEVIDLENRIHKLRTRYEEKSRLHQGYH